MDTCDAVVLGFFSKMGTLTYAYGKGRWVGLNFKIAYGCLLGYGRVG